MGKGNRRGDKSEEREERSFRIKIRLIDGGISLVRTALRGGFILGGLYIVATGVAPFAGQSTNVVALVSAMVDLQADRYFFLTTAVLTGTAWWQERRRRRKLIVEWGSYIKELETAVDPHRSSSGLSSEGRPRKEDDDAL